MSKVRKRRTARRRLKAHTKQGENRHVRSAAQNDKQRRLAQEHHAERSSQPQR